MMITCPICRQLRETPPTPKGVPRPPRGWKRVGDQLLCSACVRIGYRILTVTLPITGPLDRTWAEFGAACREAWAETTRCANWLATELYARDVRRESSDEKLRPMPRIYLYPDARVLFPAISPINLTAVIQQVEKAYCRRRHELLWQRSVSLPTFRYPVPTPLHRQGWRLEETAGGALIAHVRLGSDWWALRLRTGQHFFGQRDTLRQVIAGTAMGQAGALYAIRANDGDARHAERGQRVMLKLVVWVPRVSRPSSAIVATVQTSCTDLLVVRIPGRGIVHQERADHLRRLIAGYEVRRARLAATLAVVRRWRASEYAGLLARLDRLGHNHHRAVKTLIQEAGAHIAKIVRRADATAVIYEDETQDWCQPFPWHALRLAVQHACEGYGLAWTYASDQVEAASVETARNEVTPEMSA